MTKNYLKQLEKLLKIQKASYSDIQKALGVSYDKARLYVQELKDQGVPIEANYYKRKKQLWIPSKPLTTENRYEISVPLNKDGSYTLGVLSCTHMGSKYSMLNALNDFYDILADRHVKVVLNGGDVIEGIKGSSRQGQLNELVIYGYDNMLDYTAENYPKREGITTYMISGNHDNWFKDNVGAKPLKDLSMRRKDMKYLGDLWAEIKINPNKKGKGTIVFLQHGTGGTSYARCFSDDTETLTKTGWKLIKDVTKKDLVATRNNEGFLEWNHPTALFEYDWNNYLLHFESRGFDMLVTPNHNMFVRRYPKLINRVKNLVMPQKSHQRLNTSWQLIEAQDLFNDKDFVRQKWQMSKEVKWKGKEELWYDLPKIIKRKFASKEPHHFKTINMDLWLEFLGWYISEGSLNGKNGKVYATTITQKKKRGRALIKKLMTNLGWDARYYGNKTITIFGEELAQHLKDICGAGSYNKKVPEFIKDLSSRQIKIFLTSLLEGDGSKDNSNDNRDWNAYSTVSNQLKDDLQELFLKIGWGSKVNNRGLSLSLFQNLPTINKRPEYEWYDGKVYDIEVPYHTFLIRRKGKVIWSGNSYKLQKYLTSLQDKPDIFLLGHYHSDATARIMGTYAFQLPCFKSGDPFEKGLTNEHTYGGYILTVYPDEDGKPLNIRYELISYKSEFGAKKKWKKL